MNLLHGTVLVLVTLFFTTVPCLAGDGPGVNAGRLLNVEPRTNQPAPAPTPDPKAPYGRDFYGHPYTKPQKASGGVRGDNSGNGNGMGSGNDGHGRNG